MNNLTIENLGKRYIISGPAPASEDPVSAPRQLLDPVRRLFRRGSGNGQGANDREFWALRDVSLNVAPGTILGIIGANGAGKSTLLKVIARVIAPTVGRVVGVGRVVSLLELGAGFDAEVAALENVIMNAALSGFSRAHAIARFDDIIEFAELGDFIDQP